MEPKNILRVDKPEILDWDDYYFSMAKMVSTRSTCIRKQVGCVITRENYLLSTGYNGALPKQPECIDIGCLRDQMNIQHGTNKDTCRAMHAEQNAVAAAARNGIALKGATCYVTLFPCINCAKALIMAGITRIVVSVAAAEDYMISPMELLTNSNVTVTIIDCTE